MKKRLLSLALALVMCLSLLPPTAFAAGGASVAINDTNFPDANFRAYVKTLPGAKDDVFTQSELTSITSIDCSGSGKSDGEKISNLTGIEHFTALTKLYCDENKLTELDLGQNTQLTYLLCIGNQLSKLDLSKHPRLATVYCQNNQLTELKLSQNSALRWLECGQNKLTSLDLSMSKELTHLFCSQNELDELTLNANNKLLQLNCSENNLTDLNLEKNTSLTKLDCYDNKLPGLNLSKNTALTHLDCSNNQLTTLDIRSNTALTQLLCYGNQLTSLDLIKNTDLKQFYAHGNQRIVADGTALTAMDPNFDPAKASSIVGGSFDGGNVNFTADELTYNYDCGGGKSESFKLIQGAPPAPQGLAINDTNFPDANFRAYVKTLPGAEDDIFTQEELEAIDHINCRGINKSEEEKIANLTGIEHFTALTYLDCSNNKLTELDVSQNTALSTLICFLNQLTSLNLRNNIHLVYLDLGNNMLTALDLSKNTKLGQLYCPNNQLTSLDLSENANLNSLRCDNNQLTSLNLSKNPLLMIVDCSWNQLTSLDVGKNAKLTKLDCSNNQLTTLDLSKNAKLTVLDCSNNQLTNLKLGNTAKLSTLDCYDNKLTALDVSQHAALNFLDCVNNQLTALDVSQNTALNSLDCGYNKLTSLDLSKNTELISLACSDNQLTSLDLSKNTKLTSLTCFNNQRTVANGMELAVMDAKFDPAKASNIVGGNFDGGKVNFAADTLTYSYDCGRGETVSFKLVKAAPVTTEATVTFKVVNGTWADNTTADKTVTVTLSDGNGTLLASQIPTGMIANAGYENGTWDKTPNITTGAITGNVTYTYSFVEHQPVISEATVTFKVINGTWADSTTADKTVKVTLSDGNGTLAADQVPTGMIANAGYENGTWDKTPNITTGAITGNVTYTYSFKEHQPVISEATVTFKVVNGTWADNTTADKTVKVTLSDGEGTLLASQIPTGMIASAGYENGTWDVTPNTTADAITGNVTYTYTFVEHQPVIGEATVTFKVVNGTWADNTTADKTVTVTLSDGEGTLLASQIPTGMVANAGYENGAWDVTPNTTANAITGNVTYTYSFKEHQPVISEATVIFKVVNGTWADNTTANAITGNVTYTYSFKEHQPVISEATVIFKVVNGTWADNTTADKTVTVTLSDGEGTLLASQIPTGMVANAGYENGTWDKTPNITTGAITGNVTYTYSFVEHQPVISEATVTFKVVNGTWADNTTADKTVNVTLSDGEGTLLASQIPTGMIANAGYENGAWNVAPNTTANAITGNVTYTYSFKEHQPVIGEATVTFKVVNGTWADNTTADKTVKVALSDGNGTLAASQIPTGMIASAGYENGAWDVTPNTTADAITGNVTYTYSFTPKAPVPPAENYPIQVQFVKKGWFKQQTTTLTVNPDGSIQAPNANGFFQGGYSWLSEDGTLSVASRGTVTYAQLLEVLGGTAPQGAVVRFHAVQQATPPQPQPEPQPQPDPETQIVTVRFMEGSTQVGAAVRLETYSDRSFVTAAQVAKHLPSGYDFAEVGQDYAIINGTVQVPVKQIRPVEPVGAPITVTFTISGWGSRLDGTGNRTMTVTLKPGQSITAPFIRQGFFGRTKSIVWTSDVGLQVTSGDVIHYDTLAQMLGGTVTEGASVNFRKA